MATTELETLIENETAIEDGAPTSFPKHRLTIARYQAMVEAGVFGENEPIFLWDGGLVEKMTKGRRHSISATKLNLLLTRLIPAAFHVEHEQPMALGEDGAPEPDLMVIRGTVDDYPETYPTTGDVPLVVEVADSSLAIDSSEVFEAYASASIPVYWIVDVKHRRVVVHDGPSGPASPASYQGKTIYKRGEEIPVVLDGREVGRVAVDAIFPVE